MSQVEDVVLLKNLAMKVKEIVTVLVMVVSMMDIKVVKVILSVGRTTARSLEHTTTRRTIAVRNQHCLY